MKKTLLAGLLLLIPGLAFAQSACPGTSYLGWGVAQNGYPYDYKTLYITFPNDAGYAYVTFNGDWTSDEGTSANCTEGNWNAKYQYGNVVYDDGEVAYTGLARFQINLIDYRNLSGYETCYDGNGVIYWWGVQHMNIRSCGVTHGLTNRFFAIGNCPDYCLVQTNVPCAYAGHAVENYMTFTISGSP